ncbi:MAG: hypothetical protein KIC94_05095 [Clostridiales bacterium]|nr:hypothetical protein [Clostridiales bacterium]
MPEWNDEYINILLCYSDRLVQIKCDYELMKYLALPGNGAVELSKYIKENYKKYRNKNLDISIDSLAIEILAHAYIDKFAETIEKINNRLTKNDKNEIIKVMEKIKNRTEIIDCGEKAIDSNRIVWDMLKPVSQVIYTLLGKHA